MPPASIPHALWDEINEYAHKHCIETMYEFCIQEMAYHRPQEKDWLKFLLETLTRYRKQRKQLRPLMGKHIKHKEVIDYYCGQRSLRDMCQAAAWLVLEARPEDPIDTTEKVFSMPDDITDLYKRDILKKRYAQFVENPEAYRAAYGKGLVVEEDEESALHSRLNWFYALWDSDNSGYIEAAELNKTMNDIGGQWKEAMAAQIDMNSDNKLDILEYHILMRAVLMGRDEAEVESFLYDLEKRVVGWYDTLAKLVNAKAIKSAEDPLGETLYKMFMIWDKDRNLSLDMAEIKSVLMDCGADWAGFAKDFEADESKKLGHFDFCMLMVKMWEGKEEDTATKALQLLQERLERGPEMVLDIGAIINPDALNKKLLTLFDMWDQDRSGYLDIAEMEGILKDLGAGWQEFIDLTSVDTRGDGKLNRIDFVAWLKKIWGEKDERTVDLALEALGKKVAGLSLTDDVLKNAINPDKLHQQLGKLFDLWDKDKSGSIEAEELKVVLRDIGMNPEEMLSNTGGKPLDREEFTEFLKVAWMDKPLETASTALYLLESRLADPDKERVAMEEAGIIESRIAATINPDEVNEKLKELFVEWDIDGSGVVDVEEVERLLKRCGPDFQGLIVDGLPGWVLETADLDGNRQLDKDEFVTFLKGLWEGATLEVANKLVTTLRHEMFMLNRRLDAIQTHLYVKGENIDRVELDMILKDSGEGWWNLDIPPVPPEVPEDAPEGTEREKVEVNVKELIAKMRTFLRKKDDKECFDLIDRLEFRLHYQKVLADMPELDQKIYKIFDIMDDDRSGKMETEELQKVLDAAGGGFAEGVMMMVDEDNSGALDKIEFAQLIKDFLEKQEGEIDSLLESLKGGAEESFSIETFDLFG